MAARARSYDMVARARSYDMAARARGVMTRWLGLGEL